MFYFLHRIYVLAWVALLLGGAVWVYSRTGVAEPLGDWYTVLHATGGAAVKPVGEISGRVIKVTDGTSVILRASDRQLYSIGLLAVVPPKPTSNPTEGELAQRSKARLTELVLSNEVQVTLTWIDPQRRGVGLIHLGNTNVNAAMVESGLAQLRREFIKGLPLLDQYALVRADRIASETRWRMEMANESSRK